MRRLVCLVLVLAAVGCGSEEANVDPRCEALCAIEEPPIEGAGDICSATSAEGCKAECMARVEQASTLCSSCLLEDACFDCGDGDVVLPDFCEGGVCTKTGRQGDCDYPEGNEAAEEDCERQVNPRREVACEAEFRSVTECATVCDGA